MSEETERTYAPVTREWCENYPGTAAGVINNLARRLDALSPPPDAPNGWRAVLKDLRLGLAAGSRSISNTDFEVEYGGALLDAVEERLDALSPPPDDQMAVDARRWREAVAKAYAVLWCVNNEPGTPHLYSPERGAYEARKLLRELLTHEERGQAINAVIACGCRIGECESKPAPARCRMADEIGDRRAQ